MREEFLIACINDDRPPALAAPQMILRPGETAYGEFRVSLMKQVTQREWRGTSSGVSIPIGRTGIRPRGVRYARGLRGFPPPAAVIPADDLLAVSSHPGRAVI